jgi:hypothetical protein
MVGSSPSPPRPDRLILTAFGDAADPVEIPCDDFSSPLSVADLGDIESELIIPTGDTRGAAVPRPRGIRHNGGAIPPENQDLATPLADEFKRTELARVHREHRQRQEYFAEFRRRHYVKNLGVRRRVQRGPSRERRPACNARVAGSRRSRTGSRSASTRARSPGSKSKADPHDADHLTRRAAP